MNNMVESQSSADSYWGFGLGAGTEKQNWLDASGKENQIVAKLLMMYVFDVVCVFHLVL